MSVWPCFKTRINLVCRVLARKSLPRTNQNSHSALSDQIRNNSKKDKTKTSQMMGWIENRPNKFLNQNFVRQGLPAKSKTRRFRFISLIITLSISMLHTSRNTSATIPFRQSIHHSGNSQLLFCNNLFVHN